MKQGQQFLTITLALLLLFGSIAPVFAQEAGVLDADGDVNSTGSDVRPVPRPSVLQETDRTRAIQDALRKRQEDATQARQDFQNRLQDNRDEFRTNVQDRRDDLKDAADEKRDTLRDAADAKRDDARQRAEDLRTKGRERADEVRENISERRDEARKQLAEAQKDRIRAFLRRMLERFENAIDHLNAIADRIESRMEKIADVRDVDLSEARAELGEARSALSAAREELRGIISDAESALDQENPREAFGRVVKESLAAARDSIHEAQRALRKSVAALKDALSQTRPNDTSATNSGGDESNDRDEDDAVDDDDDTTDSQ